MRPIFLSLAEILEIHRDQIERYGGSAGVRNLGLLQSAVAMPAAGFGENDCLTAWDLRRRKSVWIHLNYQPYPEN